MFFKSPLGAALYVSPGVLTAPAPPGALLATVLQVRGWRLGGLGNPLATFCSRHSGRALSECLGVQPGEGASLLRAPASLL